VNDVSDLKVVAAVAKSSTPDHSSTGITKRATITECTPDQEAQLTSAIPRAQAYAVETAQYTNALTADTVTPRWTTWFGPFTDDSYSVVKNAFNRIVESDFNSFTYECLGYSDPDFDAEVYPDE
jgi:peptidyl-Lys metalloendopeptidase